MTKAGGTRPRRRRGLLSTWAGDSVWRRAVAWTVQQTIPLLILAIGIAIVWFLLVPLMISGVQSVIQNP